MDRHTAREQSKHRCKHEQDYTMHNHRLPRREQLQYNPYTYGQNKQINKTIQNITLFPFMLRCLSFYPSRSLFHFLWLLRPTHLFTETLAQCKKRVVAQSDGVVLVVRAGVQGGCMA